MADQKKSKLLPNVSEFPNRSETLIIRAESLLDAGGIERLDSNDRRDALRYLGFYRRDLSNTDLGRIFGVSEKTIRDDKEILKRQIEEEFANSDSVPSVLTDIHQNHQYLVLELEKSLKKCTYGTGTFAQHIKLLAELEKDYISTRQSLGMLPKNLGSITKKQYLYKTYMDRTGGVTSLPVDKEDLEFIEGEEVKNQKLLTEGESEADKILRLKFEAEFSDAPKVDKPIPPTGGKANGTP